MKKVDFFDSRLRSDFAKYLSTFSTVSSLLLIFIDIPDTSKIVLAIIFSFCLVLLYIALWYHLNTLRTIELDVEGSKVTIKVGDLFNQEGLKAIAFNEYFDTLVDEKVISSKSLNGIFINKFYPTTIDLLDRLIDDYNNENNEVLEINKTRKNGKNKKYEIGTICVIDDYLVSAFTRFDENNKAFLTMPDYLTFLIKFWDAVNKLYAQRDVSVPIFGSGITRIKEHKGISDEDLLKIMLWTFRISEMRFKYPAKLTIIITEEKIKTINLLDIKSAKNGM